MSNLGQVSQGTAPTKSWFNIVAGTITTSILNAASLIVQTVRTNSLTLIEQADVPNPAVGSQTLFVDSASGLLSTQDSNGDTLPYVPTSGAVGPAAMTGNIDMGENSLINWVQLTAEGDIFITSANSNASVMIGGNVSSNPAAANVAVGNATTNGSNQIAIGPGANTPVSGLYQIAIGRNTSCVGNVSVTIGQSSGCNGATSVSIGSVTQCNAPNSVAIGASAVTTTGGNFQIAIGSGARVSSTTGSGLAIGHQAAIDAGADGSLAIGDMAECSAAACIAIGPGAINSVANSVLIGNTSIVNFRPDNNSTCDLGTTTRSYKTCWLRDAAAASGCKYSQYGPVTVANTAAQTSFATGTAMGSLVMSANQTPGTVLRIKANLTISQLIGDSSVIRIKTNGNPLVAVTVGPGAALTTAGLDIQAEIVILGGGNAQCELRGLLTDEPLSIVNATSAWDQTAINTLDFSIQFSEANAGDTVTCNFLYVETLFAQ